MTALRRAVRNRLNKRWLHKCKRHFFVMDKDMPKELGDFANYELRCTNCKGRMTITKIADYIEWLQVDTNDVIVTHDQGGNNETNTQLD